MKGADVVMAGIVQYNDWLEEEVRFASATIRISVVTKQEHSDASPLLCGSLCQCGNMAREGLRVLVVSKKSLTEEQYQDFEVSSFSVSRSSPGATQA